MIKYCCSIKYDNKFNYNNIKIGFIIFILELNGLAAACDEDKWIKTTYRNK